jgi:tRNA(fMet)-specific endonuclease VapC
MGALDQLIAAHAVSRGATIVTSDRAFTMVAELEVEDWTQ